MLLKNGFSAAQIESIARDFRNAGLEPGEVALMTFAQRVITDAASITANEIEQLRGFGLSDADIVDVVLAATTRAFFSKTVDALGAQPEASILEDEPHLRSVLMIPRGAP